MVLKFTTTHSPPHACYLSRLLKSVRLFSLKFVDVYSIYCKQQKKWIKPLIKERY